MRTHHVYKLIKYNYSSLEYPNHQSNPNRLTCHILCEGPRSPQLTGPEPISQQIIQVDRHLTYADYPDMYCLAYQSSSMVRLSEAYSKNLRGIFLLHRCADKITLCLQFQRTWMLGLNPQFSINSQDQPLYSSNQNLSPHSNYFLQSF